MLFSQFCNQEDMLYTTNCLKVTLSFQFLVIFVVSKVPDKRMHLDFVFEAFQGDNAYYQFTSLTAVIFPVKSPLHDQDLSAFMSIIQYERRACA